VFGRHCLISERRSLRVDDQELTIAGKAFDVLVTLIERRDRVVLKDELLELVWPGRVVEENNLTVHIAHLRKILGSGVIATFSGRGYRFIAPVKEMMIPPTSVAIRERASVLTNLPARAAALIGREAELAQVASLLETHRIVTLTGAGGIGKTRLALEVARQASMGHTGGAWLAELGSLARGDLAPSAIASALHLDIAGRAEPLDGLIWALQSRGILLILDNCEHLIAPVAGIVEALIRGCPDLVILATSREPLRVEGEAQYRLEPLTVPSGDALDQTEALRYSAVQLFVTRVKAALPGFDLDEDSLRRTVAICRRLDGIPLAIELAAGSTAALGLSEVAARLDDRFAVLTHGRRTLERHRTLRAALDWSYDLLDPLDQAVFRRLSVFSGAFGLEAAVRVASSEQVTSSQVLGSIANLVAKSLVSAEMDSAETRYRLLETMRAYAVEKLVLACDRDETAQRHAEYHRDLFDHAARAWRSNSLSTWLAADPRRLDDIHAAIDWSVASNRDVSVAAVLAAATVPIWLELSLIEEGLRRVERAVAELESRAGYTKALAMMLYAALARLQLYSVSDFRACEEAWAEAFRLAEDVGDADYAQHILWGAYAGFMSAGRFREAVAIAGRFRRFAEGRNRAEQLIGHRMIGNALSRLGDQVAARSHTEIMLNDYAPASAGTHATMFGGDQRALGRASLARILWLQGFPDQAMHEIEESCEVSDQDLSILSHRLVAFACPVALWTGNLAEAERYARILRKFTAERASEMRDHVNCISGEVLLAQGDAEGALALLRPAIGSLRRRGAVQHLTWQLSVLARVSAEIGDLPEALSLLDKALQRCRRNGEGWCRPELVRIRAEILLRQGNHADPAIDRLLSAALRLANRQGAHSWALRIATSLARLRLMTGRRPAALEALKPVYRTFIEGFDTADLREARALLRDAA
jgi:predicted ATPase/DNA-binding winged helix-turn-helix (wHTH) protein